MGKLSWGSGNSVTGIGVTSVGVTNLSNGGSNLGDGDSWLVDGVAGLLNDRGLDDLVNLVNTVGLGNWVGLLDLNGVWLGNVGLVDNLLLNWDGVWDWDINGVTVDLEFRLDTADLGSDLGVSADWGQDLLLSHGVSWGRSIVTGGWGDNRGSWGWDNWAWKFNC
jgi:hypothetical protein